MFPLGLVSIAGEVSPIRACTHSGHPSVNNRQPHMAMQVLGLGFRVLVLGISGFRGLAFNASLGRDDIKRENMRMDRCPHGCIVRKIRDYNNTDAKVEKGRDLRWP